MSAITLSKVQIEMPIFESKWTERLDEFKQIILDYKKENPDTCKDSNVNANWRSAWNLHEVDSRFSPIVNYFEGVANSIGKQYFSTNGIYEVINLWAMDYGPNEGTKFHSHFPSALSLIFYIDVEENSAPICFGDTCRSVENGLVLAFDASLPHWVPDNHEGRRIVISANIDHVPPQLRGYSRAI
jgi:hypothetical protein